MVPRAQTMSGTGRIKESKMGTFDPNWKFDGDAVLLGDKSGSMDEPVGGKSSQPNRKRWAAMEESFLAIAGELCERDDDGITVGFFSDSSSDRKLIDHVLADQVEPLFKKYGPYGSTYLASTLQAAIDLFVPEKVLEEPIYKKVEERSGGFLGIGGTVTKVTKQVGVKKTIVKQNPVRPVFIAIFTDGAAGDGDAIVNVIVNATKRITDRSQLGILFVQVGNDSNATAFLDKLNNDLGDSGAEHDIVAVVKLEDLEDDSPDQTIFRAFSE
jgi:hypothetical protein